MCYFPTELPTPTVLPPFTLPTAAEWIRWRDGAAIPAKTPFLLSPRFDYDTALNGFFMSADMLGAAYNTQIGYARDLKAFLNFLWHNRNRVTWRDASTADHLAYLAWRRRDPAGPRVDDSTWDREVTAVNRFYGWQVSAKHLAQNPIPQRARRAQPSIVGHRAAAGTTPATYSHGAGREKIEWAPPATYRRWRDVGLRGYSSDGLPDHGFRGRWAQILDFTTVPPACRIMAKELFYAMLSGKLPDGEPRPSLSTIRTRFTEVRPFLIWADRQSTLADHELRFASIVGADLVRFNKQLSATSRNQSQRVKTRTAVRMLWRYRDVLSDTLSFDPAHLDGWRESKQTSAENRTDRIPEQVHGPLLAWAIRFVDVFAPDILAAHAEWATWREASSTPRGRNRDADRALMAVLDGHIRRNQPLPGYRGKISVSRLATLADCSRRTLMRHHSDILAVAAKLESTDRMWSWPARLRRAGQRGFGRGVTAGVPSISTEIPGWGRMAGAGQVVVGGGGL